ncbi:DUF6282 family protein [Alicyclobacillus acidocaldarius]|uniref:Cytosolic protein n=1 Tax=Alicyclobacillus acidocaldarius subsp. acidocaldarius (strain ATCC 27009 / DSM 446 / BCRC 14685 / JCM 5260 / KCTC 1825 / NBRC 15652 / NCIMB 11725 / NRRL B-14509 / 104-IA) TaxID=521098 RepID=C8WX03_ALIAD|nr:DUF6282 family protein [Alicyclobacillus acidocaldarius]ACV58625.1 conserved hypothetical protein [Alicyclobacillus acidocaldarius subsp. acidocaldarius DSM 446]
MAQREDIVSLLNGLYDLHVHVWPDLVERSIDDVSLARQFRDLGWSGFALKSHYFPTVERAKVVSGVVPEVDVVGAVVLNHAVGGFNPVAVDIAGRAGARIVWLPTVDAANESPEKQAARGQSHLPFWARIQSEVRAEGIGLEPISVWDEQGHFRSDLAQCLERVRHHQMALATGHLARDEIFAVVERARALGIQKVIVTHALFPSEALSIEDQVKLADLGAFIEHCYTTFYTQKCDWGVLFEAIRAVGPERTLLSTDLGQTSNPGVVDGILDFATRLLDAGFSPDALRTMWVDNPRKLIGREA